MKLFCYIISIYIIGLLLFPCQNNGDLSFTNKTEKSANHNHEEQGCHTCPPFCVCDCCQVNTIISLKTIINSTETVPVLFICIYKETPLKDIILSIWQPPKA